ncbi:amino acid ABC transporter permease [Rhodoplanes sp. TEM]|uniref:Amino acid ABC transporter permease n=1 Tax=Rhodoplanes tepidamans TaxID=200616 RepID=A0ABT5JJ88_RHOTP|nr:MULTISPECIES: amino acid ABC transporter permease [Rhodoplanes]MDC7789789.1 amino acid ABC transporter permease [Rhodoplanes tepidamans]MDC7987371.1 amino acid ABC transporter permease [Rhodoplanes sp. TEM]MDQ0357463.1 general L-amino acid transport system permease protein [Rhodoplanes tepidamans]
MSERAAPGTAASASAVVDVPLWRRPRVRGIVYQAVLCLVVALLAWAAIANVSENLARANIATGFDFWNVTAGFDISQTLIPYSAQASTYGRAFWVGLLNTLLVAVLGIVLATVLGFLIGIGRLSHNFLVSKLCGGYVELIRNVPLLLQLLFWYNAVLKALPEIRESVALPGGGYLNNRGLFLPDPQIAGGGAVALALVAGIVLAIGFRALHERIGPLGRGRGRTVVSTLLVLVPPLATAVVVGVSVTFAYPEMGRFNIRGGLEVLPEFVALLTGLSIYTAAFIAEAVRAGLMAVPKGQTEAASALGLRRGAALRLVIVPQAMRVIVPPLTNQYLNLTKNSSLAVAIGYPDLVQIFTGTVLNNTGQAIEVVVVTMAVYLSLSLATSALMNWYNAWITPAER